MTIVSASQAACCVFYFFFIQTWYEIRMCSDLVAKVVLRMIHVLKPLRNVASLLHLIVYCKMDLVIAITI